MEGEGIGSGQYADLRQRAEAILQQEPREVSEIPAEDIQRLIHELQVHQIELEMQNEELRRAQEALEASRARYFDLYDLAPVGYLTVGEQGLILEANLTAATLLGVARGALVKQPLTRFILPEDQDIYYRHRQQLFETGAPQVCEMRMLRADKSPFWARLEATQAQDAARGAPVCRVTMSDITERIQAEARERLAREVLELLNRPEGALDTVRDILLLVKKSTGFDAVAIRLREGDDFPYYLSSGFPGAFVQTERFLCARDEAGQIVRDSQGSPVLECMCGNVLCGRTDAALPFFTAHGSFWTNSTTKLLASTTEKERQSRTRNRCHGEGYESVALIPLRSESETLGLLQLNDHRPNRFTPEMIRSLEGLGASIGIALLRKHAEEERGRVLATEHEQRLRAETLAEVTLALASQLGRQAVLDEILRQAQRLVPFRTANVALLEGDSLRIAHWRGYEMAGAEEFMLGLIQPLSDFSLDAEAVRARKALVVPDTQQEPQWVVLDETAWIRSYVTFPLCLGEQVLGLLRLDGDAPGRFSAADAERLQPLANAAAIALENARLYDQARRDAETQTTLLREVNHRVLNNLSAIIGLLDVEARHAEAEGQTSYRPLTQNLVSRLNGLAAVHSLLSAAEWQPLELSGLAGQVIHASQQMLPRDKQVVIDVAPSPVRVTPDQAHPLALVINELAINTVKHALAGRDRAHITVRITRQDDTLALEFRDDGPGYPQEVVQAKRHRVGVYLLQNLVRSNLRGELSLYNDGGAVTVIRFPAKA
jgi:PAS domain S-box-containing protein